MTPKLANKAFSTKSTQIMRLERESRFNGFAYDRVTSAIGGELPSDTRTLISHWEKFRGKTGEIWRSVANC